MRWPTSHKYFLYEILKIVALGYNKLGRPLAEEFVYDKNNRIENRYVHTTLNLVGYRKVSEVNNGR